jgi:hypothetical protein
VALRPKMHSCTASNSILPLLSGAPRHTIKLLPSLQW